MRTFDINTVILEETWEGYRDWAEAAEYYVEFDDDGIMVPSIGYEPYSTTGQRKHLALTINNTSGSASDVRVGFFGNGLGVWVHNTSITTVPVTMLFRYKAPAAFTGATASFNVSNSPFGGTISTTVIGDSEWHTVTGTWNMQVDANLFTGGYVEVTGIANGAAGVFRFDDMRLTRVGNIYRVIDSDCPVFPLKEDWGDGVREIYGWRTAVERFDDGSEWREQLRMIPSCRLEYSMIGIDATSTSRIDQFLYRYHQQVIAVPRWQDAVPFSNTASSGHEIFALGATFTSRWFQPRQRFMIWESETNYEAEIIDTINTTRITLDPAEGAISGTFTAGVAKIVPLVPARFVGDLQIGRPNGQMGVYPLAFDVQMVQ